MNIKLLENEYDYLLIPKKYIKEKYKKIKWNYQNFKNSSIKKCGREYNIHFKIYRMEDIFKKYDPKIKLSIYTDNIFEKFIFIYQYCLIYYF